MVDFYLPPKPAIVRPAAVELRRDWKRPVEANFPPGWFPIGMLNIAGPTFDHIASTADSSNQLSYTFASQSFGEAAVDRRIIVAACAGSASIGASISTVTIGGVSATIHTETSNNGNTRNGHVAIASALVPAGTSGDIVVVYTGAGAMQECVISVYRVTRLVSGTPSDTATSDNASTLFIDIPERGILVTSGATVSGGGHTWPSPLVEDIDTGLDGVQLSNAHTPVQQTAASSFSAGPGGGGAGASRYCAASWA